MQRNGVRVRGAPLGILLAPVDEHAVGRSPPAAPLPQQMLPGCAHPTHNGRMSDPALARGQSALAMGRWAEARAEFEAALAEAETAEGCFGLAATLWWLGESQACVERCTRAYALFRRCVDDKSATRAAIWLGITYKSNFANFAAANGWLGRAQRLLEPLEPGVQHGWLWLARAYRMVDLDTAEELTARAFDVARTAGDVDLELTALAQLGHIRVGKGDAPGGFALLDEAVAAALAGERSSFDTVVYTCCDMLNACELADDLERAAQWCKVADDFVATYGCPFLYAECRIYYGSVLAAKGRWADAERELAAGLRITAGACPGLHTKALVRLATLRIRQGRLEDADQLMSQVSEGVAAEAEGALSVATLLLARGDAPAAARSLEYTLRRVRVASLAADASLSTCWSTLSWPRGSSTKRVRQRADWATWRALRRRTGRWRWPLPRGVGWRGPAVTTEPSSCWTRPARRGSGSTCRSRRPAVARRSPGWWPTPSLRLPSTTLAVLWRRSRGSARGSTPTGRGVIAVARRHGPHRYEGARATQRPGTGGTAPSGRWSVEPRDRGSALHQPQDRVTPRQQCPHQAQPA